jgi:hypothetical protein
MQSSRLNFTKFQFYSALVFYSPLILINIVFNFIAVFLFKSAVKKYGHIGGLRSKIAFKLYKISIREINTTVLDSVVFATQIKRREIMKAIDVNKSYEYIVKDERKLHDKDKTVFLCKFLDPQTAADLGDRIYQVSGLGAKRKEQLLTGTQRYTILKSCLVGWRNMRSEDGKEITFDNTHIAEMIAMIPPNYRNEIANFISGESEIEEGEG